MKIVISEYEFVRAYEKNHDHRNAIAKILTRLGARAVGNYLISYSQEYKKLKLSQIFKVGEFPKELELFCFIPSKYIHLEFPASSAIKTITSSKIGRILRTQVITKDEYAISAFTIENKFIKN